MSGASAKSKSITKKAKSAGKSGSKAKSAAKKKSGASRVSYELMIADAIMALRQRGGSSWQSIKKYIMANFPRPTSEDVVGIMIRRKLKTGVVNGVFVQSGQSYQVNASARPKFKK